MSAAGATVVLRAATRIFRGARTGDVRALDGVSLEVAPGSFVAIAGPSGCGKSTLLALAGALDRPDGGTVEIDGADVARASDATLAALRRGIGFVFQSAPMLRRLPLWENVTQSLVPRGAAAAVRRRAAVEALGRVGLRGFEDRRPEELSGGERQRAAVARALVAQPRLLVADEPTSQLDDATASQVLAAIDGARRAGATVVVATHDAAVVARADRTVRLAHGRVV